MTNNDKRVSEYKRLLKETAKQLGESTDSEVCRHVASFKVLRANLLAKMLLGETVDPGHLIEIDRVLKQYLPQGKPIKVEIEIVHGKGPALPPPDPPSPLPTPTPLPTDTKPSAPQAPVTENVVPLRRGVSDSAFHDQRLTLPNGATVVAPLKRLQRDPCETTPIYSPTPDWGAAHPLPPIPREWNV